MRGRSYSPSPPRGGYGRRGRSPSPRGRYGGRGGGRDLPTSLLVRNLRLDCRSEDLRKPFGQFGPLKDIYLPKDYYSGEPRGFGFVQYVDPADAEEAKYHMDGSVLLGRQLTVVFAEENRKKPTDMRARERPSKGKYYDRRRSPPRYSRSPPPRYERSPSRSRDNYSPPPKRRQYSRSGSPQEERRYSREKSFSRSPNYKGRGRSPIPEHSPPPHNGGGRSLSRSPVRAARSPPRRGSPSRIPSRSRSPAEYLVRAARSPPRRGSPSRIPSRSRSPAEYSRMPEKDLSPSP